MAQITRSVSEKGLDEVVKWYFSRENLRQASDVVVAFTKALKLRIHFKDDPELTFTSSDGQKFEVAGDSLLARPSFKYFGNRRGVTAYNYTDDTLLLFDSLVCSAGDREATYLLNGLVNTQVVDSDVHSSDSHGATEPVFGCTYLLGVRFEPRIKNFLRQQLYSIEAVSRYKDLNYPLMPSGRIQTERIEEQWDAILRLITTIRLHHSSPSELFSRLNSYASENPLYRGLKEFGRLIKTIFITRYVDDVEMRQRVHRQLNRGESVHQLVKSVWFGRHGQMGWVSRQDQEIAETAKRLILNCIICYNYLHLSQLISKISDREERRAFVKRLSKLSVLTHHHINFNGIYDFPSESDDLTGGFDWGKIEQLEL
jgi:TnpA family transposase